jgi:hypothetical protein
MNKYRQHSRRSQDAHRRWRACGRKRAYATRDAALVANPRQSVYECRYCHKFHCSNAAVTLSRQLENMFS